MLHPDYSGKGKNKLYEIHRVYYMKIAPNFKSYTIDLYEPLRFNRFDSLFMKMFSYSNSQLFFL